MASASTFSCFILSLNLWEFAQSILWYSSPPPTPLISSHISPYALNFVFSLCLCSESSLCWLIAHGPVSECDQYTKYFVTPLKNTDFLSSTSIQMLMALHPWMGLHLPSAMMRCCQAWACGGLICVVTVSEFTYTSALLCTGNIAFLNSSTTSGPYIFSSSFPA